ncbi:MAG: flavin reductase [Bacteroidota bacterium]
MGVKRPWNIVDMPVYSLATYSEDSVNMNICTYVSSISMKPKIFMVAVDYNTLTFERLDAKTQSVLQILHMDQIDLVKKLGKKSGKNFDKNDFLVKNNHLENWNNNQVLTNACGYLQLEEKGRKNVGGDHELFWFEVTKSKTKSEEGVLMFQKLIEGGIIL